MTPVATDYAGLVDLKARLSATWNHSFSCGTTGEYGPVTICDCGAEDEGKLRWEAATAIRFLEAELSALRAERDAAQTLINYANNRLDALRAQVEGMRKDAERLRELAGLWWPHKPSEQMMHTDECDWWLPEKKCTCGYHDMLRAINRPAIDAARQGEGE